MNFSWIFSLDGAAAELRWPLFFQQIWSEEAESPPAVMDQQKTESMQNMKNPVDIPPDIG